MESHVGSRPLPPVNKKYVSNLAGYAARLNCLTGS